MPPPPSAAQIVHQISQATGQPFAAQDWRPVSGGCINQGYRVRDQGQTYFVKLNQAHQLAMFEAEAAGLQQIRDTQTIRVPQPICWGTAAPHAYLVLEWLELGRGGKSAWQQMGQQLAQLHQFRQATAFGWERDNTIGATPQINTWTADWSDFFSQHRLGYQFQLAQAKGGHFPKQSQLMAALPELLAHHDPQPAIVHGDLWSGNAAIAQSDVQSEVPVIFDPACYWGDREVDIAMTELFGGFPPEFYQGYEAVFPLDTGYARRKILYNLYHILNHFNLFGGSYQGQANRIIAQILQPC